MSDTLLTNIGTIGVALFAGMIALYQVKLNIISNARIKWIEGLRDTLSQYCEKIEDCSESKNRLLYEINNKEEKEHNEALDKFYNPYASSAKEVLKLQSKTFLYLNSNDEKHKQIEELLRQNSLLLHEKHRDNGKAIHINTEKIVSIAKDVFKAEWKRSKKMFKI
ncbi:MAG: hypothetical protein V4643_14340 [Bacteroidota bacterium]